MSQGFYTAMSGITSSQQKIDVISDNIANINTVGFKESMINFSDVFTKTITLGSAPTRSLGGTNPMQIGLGTKVANISKNYASGTPQSTGVISDLYLDGQGFFCVQGANGEVLMTRAGNFTVDSDGYLTTSNGNKIIGTSTSYSIDSSTTPIRIPPMLTLATQGNSRPVNFLTNTPLAELNALKFEKSTSPTATDFIVEVTYSGGVKQIPVNISSANNLQAIMTDVNNAIDIGLGVPNGGSPTAHGISLQATVPTDGTLSLTINKAFSSTSLGVTTITRISKVQLKSVSSNFGNETKLAAVAGTDSDISDPGNGTITYMSKILDYEATVGPPDNVLNASKLVSYYISGDGAIEATYSNGDKISVEINPANKQIQTIYKMANGTEIKYDDTTINASIIEPANLQLQLASVVNENGLIACGNNNFKPGPNAGEVMYSIASSNGFAKVTSGSLESSNVDLTKQFAELIVAQRSIEANSRTFDTVSRVLQGLIQMGR